MDSLILNHIRLTSYHLMHSLSKKWPCKKILLYALSSYHTCEKWRFLLQMLVYSNCDLYKIWDFKIHKKKSKLDGISENIARNLSTTKHNGCMESSTIYTLGPTQSTIYHSRSVYTRKFTEAENIRHKKDLAPISISRKGASIRNKNRPMHHIIHSII